MINRVAASLVAPPSLLAPSLRPGHKWSSYVMQDNVHIPFFTVRGRGPPPPPFLAVSLPACLPYPVPLCSLTPPSLPACLTAHACFRCGRRFGSRRSSGWRST